MDKFPLRSFCAHAISSQFLDAPFPSLQYLRFAITITTRSTFSPSHGLSLCIQSCFVLHFPSTG